jgi:predicted DNA-binding transcriptional regulator
MPPKFTIIYGSVAQQILSYLRKRPRSKYRPPEIAAALGLTTVQVGNECARLYRRGLLDRETTIREGKTLGISYYRIKR